MCRAGPKWRKIHRFFPAFARFYADFMLWRNSHDPGPEQKSAIAVDRNLQCKQCLARNLSVTAASSIRGCIPAMRATNFTPIPNDLLRFKGVATSREPAYPGTSKISRNQAAFEARRP
jgi:hypothetical protein